MAKRGSDFGDTDDVLAVMADELQIDADDLDIDDSGRGFSSFGVGTFWYVQTSGGRKGWVVAQDSDTMRELALAVVTQDLETEPELFNQDFLESHIDVDRLRRDLHSDVQNGNYDYFNEQDDDELIEEASRAGYDTEDYLGEDEDGEPTITDRDGLVEALSEKRTEEELRDPMQYLEDLYGREDAVKQAIEIAGIDIAAAAEEAVDTDGPEHFLAPYDGNSYELDNGWVYWRTD